MAKKWLGLAMVIALLAIGGDGTALPRQSGRTLDLKTVEYGLNLKVDFDQEKLFGECRLTVLNPTDRPVERIPLILYRLLKVTAAADSAGAALPFSQAVTAYEDWDRIQFNFVEVTPGAPIPPGAKATIALRYEGYPGGYREEGIQYVRDKVDKDFTILRMDGFAYPVVGVPSEQANRAAGLQAYDYRIDITVPEPYFAANGGRLTGRVSRDGKTTFSYRAIKPAWRMDVAIALYKNLEDSAGRLVVDYFERDAAGAAAVMKAMKDSLALYSGWLGPLAGEMGLTIIEIPEGYGSQADVTAILLTRDGFNNPDRLTDLYHEISHLWSVNPLDRLPSRLESEGLAMFFQYLVREKLEKKPGALEQGAQRIRGRFAEQCRKTPANAGIAIADYGKKDVTDLSYTKGMLFFYVLDRIGGEKALLDAVAAYYQNYHQKGASLADFLDVVQKTLKKDLSKLYQDWIYGSESSSLLLGSSTLEEIVKRYL